MKRISREKVKELKRLKKTGMSAYKIAKQVGCCEVTVKNYTSKKSRERHRTYQRERYQNDEEFRAKVTAGNVKTQKRYKKEGKTWTQLHPIKAKKYYKKYMKIYNKEHEEELKLKQKKYRAEHKEELRLKAKEYSSSPEGKKTRKSYFRKNKDKIAIKHKKWRLKNKDKIAEAQREYQQNNREIVNSSNRKSYKKKILKRKKKL